MATWCKGARRHIKIHCLAQFLLSKEASRIDDIRIRRRKLKLAAATKPADEPGSDPAPAAGPDAKQDQSNSSGHTVNVHTVAKAPPAVLDAALTPASEPTKDVHTHEHGGESLDVGPDKMDDNASKSDRESTSKDNTTTEKHVENSEDKDNAAQHAMEDEGYSKEDNVKNTDQSTPANDGEEKIEQPQLDAGVKDGFHWGYGDGHQLHKDNA